MNKTDIVEIMLKRPTKLALISVVFVIMIIVLVPVIIEEVDARTDAKATSLIGPFSNVKVELSRGSFWTSPSQPSPNVVTWVTWGGCPFGHCSEIGRFTANVGAGLPEVVVTFANPGSGPNSCSVGQSITPYRTTCHITQGISASLTIMVTPRVLENNNGYCDILDKFGGIEQTGVIRDKIRC